MGNVPTNTLPSAKTEGFANAVIKLIATTVPGNAHGNITAISIAAFPRNRIRASTYAQATPSRMVPSAAIALISRLFLIGSQDRGSENNETKFWVVYSDGSGAVLHEPFTANARTKIIAIGRI